MAEVISDDVQSPAVRLQRQLQFNHSSHEVLRSAAEGFFNHTRLTNPEHTDCKTRLVLHERLLEAFMRHFDINAQTEYSLFGGVVEATLFNWRHSVGWGNAPDQLQEFTIRAKLTDDHWYDFVLTL